MTKIKPIALPMPFLPAALALVTSCATAKPFVADNTYDEPPPSAPLGANADDVFMRKPWEMWNVPSGKARFHRDAKILLPDSAESFKVGEVSVYAADGSDVQLDYSADGLGEHAQSRVSVRVSVYRAPADLETEWQAMERKRREKQGAASAEPWPLPDYYPRDTRQMAWTVPVGDSIPGPAFEQILLFHSGGWSVRFKITCPTEDRNAVEKQTLAFLRWLRATCLEAQPG